jgi:hypothetical protein
MGCWDQWVGAMVAELGRGAGGGRVGAVSPPGEVVPRVPCDRRGYREEEGLSLAVGAIGNNIFEGIFHGGRGRDNSPKGGHQLVTHKFGSERG